MNEEKKINVLIAEHESRIAAMIKDALQKSGYEIVAEVASAREAIHLTESLQPDVVLMDINLPDMDSLETIRRIYENCPTPVVVLSDVDTPELVKAASEAGAGAYLVKLPTVQDIERAVIVAMARFQDIMELRRLNTELQARNEELDAFGHTVAHQLKNSAGLIATFGNILDSQLKLPEELQQYLDSIIQSGHKMNNIIAELQLLTGIRAGEVERKTLDMGQIVTEALQRLTFLIEEYQAQIIRPNEWPAAVGHAPWVEEVWINYIGNAVRYGGRPPMVEMGGERRPDGMVRFWVQDNGAGLAPAEQERLFKPFTQLERARVKGEGLGLSIVRHIVEKLGGQVGVESEAIAGQGCLFTFTLPGSQVPQPDRSEQEMVEI